MALLPGSYQVGLTQDTQLHARRSSAGGHAGHIWPAAASGPALFSSQAAEVGCVPGGFATAVVLCGWALTLAVAHIRATHGCAGSMGRLLPGSHGHSMCRSRGEWTPVPSSCQSGSHDLPATGCTPAPGCELWACMQLEGNTELQEAAEWADHATYTPDSKPWTC